MNIVAYGINKSPPKTSKPDRIKHDLTNLLSILNAVNPSIQNSSIKDLYRLGKFNQSQSRPRPILVKFLCRIDVTTTLSNTNQVKKPVIIKADMSKHERKVESMLLQEHRKLIQQGTNRKDITIRKNEISVGKLLYGKVIDQKFVRRVLQVNTTEHSPTLSISVDTEMDQNGATS